MPDIIKTERSLTLKISKGWFFSPESIYISRVINVILLLKITFMDATANIMKSRKLSSCLANSLACCITDRIAPVNLGIRPNNCSLLSTLNRRMISQKLIYLTWKMTSQQRKTRMTLSRAHTSAKAKTITVK